MHTQPTWRFEVVRSVRSVLLLVGLLALAAVAGYAQHGKAPPKVPPRLAKKGGLPPGQAGRGALPPGLAKKLGPDAPSRLYAAVDPEHTDRIWFLIDGRWVLRTGLQVDAQTELKIELGLDIPPPPPPPVPPPKTGIQLTVMFFSE